MFYDALQKEYPFRIEMHAHSMPASNCSHISPREMVDTLLAHNCHAVVMTNHYALAHLREQTREALADMTERLTADFREAYTYGQSKGLQVLFGIEIRFEENANDYLIYGLEAEDLKSMDPFLDGTLEHFRHHYQNEKPFLLIQAHPFRDGIECVSPELIDGSEVFNMHPKHNGHVSLATRWVADNRPFSHPMVMTCGSDWHHPNEDTMALLRTRTLPRSNAELLAILKSQDYLFDFNGYLVVPPCLK